MYKYNRDSLDLFLETEKKRLKTTCKLWAQKGFTVYKYKMYNNYRLGNGIWIKNSKGKSLKDWENIFSKFFTKEKYQHKTFTFINDNSLEHLKTEAQEAGYKEVNDSAIKVCYRKSFKNDFFSSKFKIHKIETEQDWKDYKKFVKEIHFDKPWHYNEGFDILRKTSDSINIERFCILKENPRKIVSVVGMWVWNNIGRVENLETHPDFRRQGLARRLLTFIFQRAIKKFHAKGLVLISSNNKDAVSLYKNFGFKIIGNKVELMNYLTY